MRAEIIRFWHTVEMFSPQSVPKVNHQERVYDVKVGEPLPWEQGHELARIQLRDDQTWRHVVYVGTYQLDSVFAVLKRVFTPDEESFDERPTGESALAAFVVSDEGRPILGSEVLSSCAWATGRVLHPGPGSLNWLVGFDDASAAFGTSFEALVSAEPDDTRAAELQSSEHAVGRPIDSLLLHKCRDAAADLTRAGSALSCVDIRVRSAPVATRNALEPDGHDFLNSFIADDLAAVSTQVAAGNVGAALREYLRSDADLDITRRVDVRKDLDAVLAATAPKQIPLGRWPSNPNHPLALGQQQAVNTAMTMPISGSGIIGVNGPPGTGKTTMLRDLIAALVVERAGRLADLRHPDEAFVDTHRWKTDDFTRTVNVLRPELTGFELVVASANNGAVENVTNEIPAADSIDAAWKEEARRLDYFPGIATVLLNTDHEDLDLAETTEPAGAAWGLMAARLGNKKNRGTFVDAFWYRKPAPSGLLAVLKGLETRSTSSTTWEQDVAEYRRAVNRAATIQADRDRTHSYLLRKARVEDQLRAAQRSLADVQTRLASIRTQLSEARSTADRWQADRERHVGLRAEHHQFKPGFVEWLTTFGRAMREWRPQDRSLAAQVTEAEKALRALRAELGALTRAAADATSAAGQHRQAVQRSEKDLAAVNSSIARAQEELGDQFPGPNWWLDRNRRERSALWTDPEWNRARTELFLAALRLHKAFIQKAATKMRQTLHAAADVVGGRAPADRPDAVLAAWQALFIVVPVVSTTFASFARLFGHLGRESLGWLLVDEAGQATPQNAVGALWRSKRAVVVGDPLQLEPITTLPFRAEQAIRRDHGVEERWLSSRTSVQRLADRLTRLGTSLPGEDESIWVGAPLTVHRRCDRPMFDIVNEVAYDGLMIDGTAPAPALRFRSAYPSLPESKWIDVVSSESQGHWIPDEGKQLDRILTTLAGLDFDMSQVMVIAPFRQIAHRVRDRIRSHPGLVAGTIHTAQGKQADIVILVLGSDPQKTGARVWAASKPNLLNVAVSRAKRRLYVIGDRRAWAAQRHFLTLAQRLPHSPPLRPDATL